MKISEVVRDVNAHILDLDCAIDADSNRAIARISFKNMAYGVITAIKFNAQGFNSFGDTIKINNKEKFYLAPYYWRMSLRGLNSFPRSNGDYAQLFQGVNLQCLLEGLKNNFEHTGGVPRRVWFDKPLEAIDWISYLTQISQRPAALKYSEICGGLGKR